MSALLLFTLALIISFVGSLQPGPVNLAVMYATLHQQTKRALFIAIGGSIPELIFSGIALMASARMHPYLIHLSYFKMLLAIIFIIAGVVLFISKNGPALEVKDSSKNGFLMGLLLASINPQLILFWTAIILSLESYGIALLSASLWEKLCFILGTGVGAFALHFLLIHWLKRNQDGQGFLFIKKHAHQLIGVLLIILGLLLFY